MSQYELKLGALVGSPPVRTTVGTFSFQASDHLSAIARAKVAVSEAVARCASATLRHEGLTVIWEHHVL